MTREEFDNRLMYTGSEVCAMMRRHRVTIRELARKTGLPLRTIRKFRELGVRGYSVLDMHEAIAGELSPRLRAALRNFQQNQA